MQQRRLDVLNPPNTTMTAKTANQHRQAFVKARMNQKAINTLLKSPAIDSTIKAVLRAEYARISPEVERLRLIGMAAFGVAQK